MALTAIVTNAGRAALVNAANTGTAPVVIAQVGVSGTAVVPGPGATTLPGESKRVATLSGDVVADDTIHLIVRDESADVFTLRSFALYLADGTLFAIYGQAGVILEKSAQAMMLLAIDVRFEDVDASSLAFGDANFLNPPATTEQIGVVELATVAEAIAGIDDSRVPAAKMVKDAVAAWLDARFGANNAGIWHPGNDGAGSGLDAGLLGGQLPSYYTNITARLTYTPVQQGTGNGQSPSNVVKIGWGAGRLKASVDLNDLGNIVFDSNITDVWRASNDGAGSGLDAGLLAGQLPSYYTDIAQRLGYTPVQQGTGSGQLPGNVIKIGWSGSRLKGGVDLIDLGEFVFESNISDVWRASNDGAGSGLDAGLLAGQLPSYYTNITARLGFNPIQQGGGAGQLNNKIYLGWSGTRLKLQTDIFDQGPVVLDSNLAAAMLPVNGASVQRNGNHLFGPDNDGSGSGVDADMLDGLHAADFLRDFGASLSSNGYMKLSNGLIIQWGTITGTFTAAVDNNVTFPIAFPNATLNLVGANSDVAAQGNAVVGFNYSPPPGPTGFKFRTSVSGQNRLNWIAIGH